MPLDTSATPVPSSAPLNVPVPKTTEDHARETATRLHGVEQAALSDIARQIKAICDFIGLPYPPTP